MHVPYSPVAIDRLFRELLLDEGIGDVLPEVEKTNAKSLELPTDGMERNRFEFHPLLKDSLKNGDLQDHLLNKLCEIERYSFTSV
jgi:hypothetical protein